MKRSVFLVFTIAVLSIFSMPASAKVPAGRTGSDKDCSANHYRVNDLVSYAEMREQRLAAASMNYISPGQNGSIRVHGWDKGDVLVRACVQTAGESESDARAVASQVSIANGPGRIEPKGPARGDHVYWDLSYEVWVPNSSNLDVNANNGSISISAVRGQIRFRTLNGSVHLAEVGGDVDGSTTNGSLAVDLTGNAWNGRGLRAQTTNGSVRLNVPENYSAKIEASTVNGGLHIDFPVSVRGDIGKTISFQLGGGGPTIETKTVNGGVHISKRA
jgi:Putative adhesin